MTDKNSILLFGKKEVLFLVILLVLVALFSFTLGLRMGRSLTVQQEPHEVESPIHEDAKAHPAPHEEVAEHDAPHGNPKESGSPTDKVADEALSHELAKGEVKTKKVVATSIPDKKTSEALGAVKYTLQVGAHRTVAEAAEQVVALKKQDLDAFYIEAKVPGKGTWYRVGIGVFDRKEQAERVAEMKKSNLPPFIVQKIGGGE